MDIGPLRSERHGEAYCAIFRKDEMPCIVVYRVPGPERRAILTAVDYFRQSLCLF